MEPFVFYADGTPVRPGDRVIWRGIEFSVLALYIDRDDDTNVSLNVDRPPDSPYPRMPRVNSRDLTKVAEREKVKDDKSVQPHAGLFVPPQAGRLPSLGDRPAPPSRHGRNRGEIESELDHFKPEGRE